MANQYVNKVEYGGSTLIDLTSDTATADKVARGETFHLASGASATGTLGLEYNAEDEELFNFSYDSTTESITIPSWAVTIE